MSVIRVNKQKSFTTVANQPFNDNRLSWEASGVMGFLLTKPDGWECRPTYLMSLRAAGKKKIRRILRELQTYGYLHREKAWDDKGRIYWITEIYEIPSLNPNYTIDPLRTDGKPADGEGYDGEGYDGEGGDIVKTNPIKTNKASNDLVSSRSNNELAAAAIDEIEDLLAQAGIQGKKQKSIARLPHVSHDYIRSHIQQAKKDRVSTGILITRIEQGDPDPGAYRSLVQNIPEEYLAIIER